MKSKLITTILLITLVFSLTACGGNSGDGQEPSGTSDTQTEEQKEEEQGETKDPETENEEPQQEPEESQDTQTPVQEPAAETATITVYYSNAECSRRLSLLKYPFPPSHRKRCWGLWFLREH